MTETIKACYVITDSGAILVQAPDNNRFGFSLFDEDQSWPGGIGAAESWEAIPHDDPRIKDWDRARLGWILGDER